MKSSVCKRIVCAALVLSICLSFAVFDEGSTVKTHAATQSQQNIVNRADYLYSLTWVAQQTVTAHAYNYYYTFYKGNTYHLPYGQGATSYYIGYGVSPQNFVKAANTPGSVFYQNKSYTGSWYSTYYITDCSGFVSWCWGLTAKQSTRSLASYSSYVGAVTVNNIRNYLQLGDALNRYDYHVVLVTDLIYDNNGTLTGIEITEQTVPETKRTIYTPSGLASAYASYDGIYRCKSSVPASPVVVEQEKEETWIEKAAFDVMVYRDRNPDLANMTDAQLKDHWKNHGIKEGRASSIILDLGFYRGNNKDLQDSFGTDYVKLYNHFITSGYKEYRKSSALFDGQYYCDNNPDVAASYKDKYLLHYVENGIKEGRRASLTYDPEYYWHIRPDVAEAWPGDYLMCARHYAGHGINAQIQAYDHSPPQISNAAISNVTAAGYTVSCTVTDDWGINQVAFPTWTLQGGQDDLADDFMNTQQGTKSGNTYTFQVKASQHNYEGGSYATHIYAVDKGGNQVKLALDTVEVKDPGPDGIVLNSWSTYVKDGSYLANVTKATSVQLLLRQFENEKLEIRSPEGNVISGTALVGTGTVVSLYDGGQLVETLTVIVEGDVDGNGKIETTDYLRVKSKFLRTFQLNEAQNAAADVDKNGTVDSTDYMRIKSQFLGSYDLYSD